MVCRRIYTTRRYRNVFVPDRGFIPYFTFAPYGCYGCMADTIIQTMDCHRHRIGIITLYDIATCFYADCPIPAIRVSVYSLYSLVGYWVCRRLLTWQPAWRIVKTGSVILMGVALLFAILSFFVFRKSVLGADFEDTYHFRFLFHPLGYITNVWSEILLLILGWGCLVRQRYTGVFAFLCVTAILLSFSRGAYIASGIYLTSYLLLMPKADKLKVLPPALAAMVWIWICCPNEMRTTLKMHQTVSQQQSTESRIHGTAAAWETFKKRPLCGHGNGNYTYALDPVIGQDSTKQFTSFPPNTLAWLSVEKGIIGILLYGLLGLAIIQTIRKQRKQRKSRIILCTLLAFLAKDMSQSAWQETPFIMLMVYLPLAYLQREEKEKMERLPISTSVCMITGATLTALLFGNTPNGIQAADPTCTYLEKEDYRNAMQRHPDDVQLRYLYASRTLLQENPAEADSILKELATDFPRNSLYLSTYAERCYKNNNQTTAREMMAKAIYYTPRLLDDERMKWWEQSDSLFYQSVIEDVISLKPGNSASAWEYAHYGYVLHWKGEIITATDYLKKALEILPNLTTPYLLLEEYDKYKLLIYGAFHADLNKMKLPDYPLINEDFLWKKQAGVKFKSWYETIPSKKD